MGFSVLSIVEIIYFISLRPYYKHRSNQKEKKRVVEKLKVENQKKLKVKVPKNPNKLNSKYKTGPKIAWMKYDTSGVDENYLPFPYTEWIYLQNYRQVIN